MPFTGDPRTGTTDWKRRRLRILARDGHRCTWMDDGVRCPRGATEVDHIRNHAAGGSDEDDNLRALCVPHHRAKTAAEGVAARRREPRARPAEPHPGLSR